MNKIEIPCKGRVEDGPCPEKVEYTPEIIPAVRGESKTVYLTCPRGHTESYEMSYEIPK